MKETFFGHKISKYGLDNGYVDYSTLAKCFNLVLCNNVTKFISEQVSGYVDEENGEEYPEIYQWYIIDQYGYEFLEAHAPKEQVYYSEELDCYIWGITHFGTGWDYVLTDIKIKDL